MREFVCLGCRRTVQDNRSVNNLKYCSLECYRKSKRPQRMTGQKILCNFCGKEVYKQRCFVEKHNTLFCSRECANKYQGRNKIVFICKICSTPFRWSASRTKNNNPTYCSVECRNKDEEWIQNSYIKGNLVQQKKKGLNKLELKGRKILTDLKLEFNEQVLMFNKFLVDILLKKQPVIIHWDGLYWHSKPKRKRLDESQDAYLRKCGYKILRFTDKEIKNDVDEVYDTIKRTVQ